MPFSNSPRMITLNQLLAFNVQKPDCALVATTLKDDNPTWPCSQASLREKARSVGQQHTKGCCQEAGGVAGRPWASSADKKAELDPVTVSVTYLQEQPRIPVARVAVCKRFRTPVSLHFAVCTSVRSFASGVVCACQDQRCEPCKLKGRIANIVTTDP